MGNTKTKGSLRRPSGYFIVGKPACGRKFCSVCGRWRLLMDFPLMEQTARGAPVYWHPRCRTCRLRQKKAYETTQYGREKKRQYDREYRAAQRRAQGIEPRSYQKYAPKERDDRPEVPVAPLQAAFMECGLNVSQVAEEAGYFRDGKPDSLRVKRMLGLVAGQSGKVYERISYANAKRLVKAMPGADPAVCNV